MISFNIKLAIRKFAKNKLYTFLTIGGFSIGFAACILIGLFYNAEMSVNRNFPDNSQIYRLYDVKKNRCKINWDLYPILINDFSEVKDACPLEYETGMRMIVKNDQSHTSAEIGHLLTTTNNFFSIFSVNILESISAKPFEGRESVLLSKKTAQKLFGSQNPLGQQVNMNNFFTATVSGIFDELPPNSSFQADMILNSENEEFRLNRTCNNGNCYNPTEMFVLLNKDSDPAAFARRLNSFTYSSIMDVDSLDIQNLVDFYLSPLTLKSRHLKGNPLLLKIFLSIGLLIIILSSINYLNYSVSMQYSKLKETGIKKTNGASWRNVFYYSLVEITIGIIISLVLSVLIAFLTLPYSEAIFGKAIYVDWPDLLTLLPAFLSAILIIILINSLVPVYILSGFRITEFLSGFKGKSGLKSIWKESLLIFQLSSSLILIAVVLIIFKQLSFVKHSDPGFDREQLVRIDLPFDYPETGALLHEVSGLSFVRGSTVSSGCPGMINHKMGSNTGESSFDINCIYVGDNYLKTLGIELVSGRDFIMGDINRACLINEEAFKQYQWNDSEGKKFNNGKEGGYDVVGVIKDFNFESFHQVIEPLALLFSTEVGSNILSVRLAQGNTKMQIDDIKKIWEGLTPYEPMNLMFYDDHFQAMYEKEEKLAFSITFFSFIALVLTCMGILGQIFMICLARIKEIGIRKVNGARMIQLLIMLNRDLLSRIITAFIIATPIAWYSMNKWLQNFAYKTRLDWWIFALAGIIVMGIALITVSWQSWRAASRNPVEALRYE